jgi:hypothetical protein
LHLPQYKHTRFGVSVTSTLAFTKTSQIGLNTLHCWQAARARPCPPSKRPLGSSSSNRNLNLTHLLSLHLPTCQAPYTPLPLSSLSVGHSLSFLTSTPSLTQIRSKQRLQPAASSRLHFDLTPQSLLSCSTALVSSARHHNAVASYRQQPQSTLPWHHPQTWPNTAAPASHYTATSAPRSQTSAIPAIYSLT